MNGHVDYGSTYPSYQSTGSFQYARCVDTHNQSLDREHPIRSIIFILSPVMLITSLIIFLHECYMTAFLLMVVALQAIFVSQTRMLMATQSLVWLTTIAFVIQLIESMIYFSQNSTETLMITVAALSQFALVVCAAHTLAGYEKLTDGRAIDMLEAEQDMVEEIHQYHELESERKLIDSKSQSYLTESNRSKVLDV